MGADGGRELGGSAEGARAAAGPGSGGGAEGARPARSELVWARRELEDGGSRPGRLAASRSSRGPDQRGGQAGAVARISTAAAGSRGRKTASRIVAVRLVADKD